MTWISTWPRYGIPQYAVHDTEQAAEAHAAEIVRSGTATHATAYQANQPTVRPDDRNQP